MMKGGEGERNKYWELSRRRKERELSWF